MAGIDGAEPTSGTPADMLQAWETVLPEVVGNQLRLGRSEQVGKFLWILSFTGSVRVNLDSDGKLLFLDWEAGVAGFAGAGFAAGMAKLPLPMVLLRSKAAPVLLTDRATHLVGENGIAITKASGEIELIPAEKIHGIATHPIVQSDSEEHGPAGSAQPGTNPDQTYAENQKTNQSHQSHPESQSSPENSG
jgi:hypothetical protein